DTSAARHAATLRASERLRSTSERSTPPRPLTSATPPPMRATATAQNTPFGLVLVAKRLTYAAVLAAVWRSPCVHVETSRAPSDRTLGRSDRLARWRPCSTNGV